MYITDNVNTVFLDNHVTVNDILQPAYPLRQTVLDYQRGEAVKNLRSLFQKAKYRDAYCIGKELSARFCTDPDCSQFLRWEATLLFAKACIYFSPRSNEGSQAIYRVNQEMDKETLQKPFFKRSEAERKQWLCLKGTAFHLQGYDLWMNMGDLHAAIKASRLALGCYEKVGMLEEAATIHDNIGRILSLSGNQEGALDEIAKGFKIRSLLGRPCRIVLSYISYADTYLHFSNISQAYWYLKQAEQLCVREENLRAIGLVSILYGRMYRLVGNQAAYTLDARLNFLERSIAYLEEAKSIFHTRVMEPIREKDAADELKQARQNMEILVTFARPLPTKRTFQI